MEDAAFLGLIISVDFFNITAKRIFHVFGAWLQLTYNLKIPLAWNTQLLLLPQVMNMESASSLTCQILFKLENTKPILFALKVVNN